VVCQAGGSGSGESEAFAAVERKAIQSFRPADLTPAFGRAEGFSWRGGSGAGESRALTMRGEGGGWWLTSSEYPAHRDSAAMNGVPMMSLVREVVGGPPAKPTYFRIRLI
jgi:hypothetical protein